LPECGFSLFWGNVHGVTTFVGKDLRTVRIVRLQV
jgi:hypothetical protein